MLGGDRQARGLLEAGAGEQHPVGELAELRPRTHAQPRLADDRRDQFGGVPGLAQTRHGAGDIVRGFDGRHLVEQPQALGREQCGQLGQVHPVSLCRD